MTFHIFQLDVFTLGAERAATIAHQSGVPPQRLANWLTRIRPNK